MVVSLILSNVACKNMFLSSSLQERVSIVASSIFLHLEILQAMLNGSRSDGTPYIKLYRIDAGCPERTCLLNPAFVLE